MTPTIYLASVDDWELSGNGSGDIHELQFRPMRELVSLYNKHGIKGSFNAEMKQQLSFRQFEKSNPELKPLADEWDAIVRETYSQGHDVQLHVHPQWSKAEYNHGEWSLSGDWSILNYNPEDAFRMLFEGKEYLERLLRPIDSDYRCLTFRAGAWCIAPSPHMLDLLVKLGIVLDMSIVGGLHYDTRNIKLDYRKCDETFLPYYPVMTDARRVSNKVEPIVCVPTNSFYGSRRQVFKHHMEKVSASLKKKVSPEKTKGSPVRSVENYGHEWAETSHSSTVTRIYEKGLVPYFSGKHFISDLAQLNYPLMKEMLASIRRRAKSSGLAEVPIILENHTKDVRDFSDIARFLSDVSAADDIQCVTLSQLAKEIVGGRFKIKTGM